MPTSFGSPPRVALQRVATGVRRLRHRRSDPSAQLSVRERQPKLSEPFTADSDDRGRRATAISARRCR
jgi:hypothetical protein